MGRTRRSRKSASSRTSTPLDFWTLTRRRFIGYAAAAGAVLVLPRGATKILDAIPTFTLVPGFTTWARRREDLVSVKLDFYNLLLDNSDPVQPKVVRKPNTTESFVVATFWPQNVAEQTFPEPGPAPDPAPIRSILANSSRLSFTLPNSVNSLSLDYDTVLQWAAWIQRVTAVAKTDGPRDYGSLTEPSFTETAIELPYRLILSPSELSRWTNATQPITHDGWTELWHTRMDEANPERRLLRAVWDRDPNFPGYIGGGPPPTLSDSPFGGLDNMTLKPDQRANIVLNTSIDVAGGIGGPPGYTSSPVKADRLMLTALGAWIDSDGIWEGIKPRNNAVLEWRQRGTEGRDHYVKVVTEGYLFPFGHPAVLIVISERKFNFNSDGVLGAYIRKREFIVIRKPVKLYSSHTAGPLAPGMQHEGRAFPLRSVRFTTLVTPNLDSPSAYVAPVAEDGGSITFVPNVSASPFLFHAVAIDWGDLQTEFATAGVFVPGDIAAFADQATVNNVIARWNTTPVAGLQDATFAGQRLNFAEIAPKADTSQQVMHVTFGAEGPVGGTSLASLRLADQAPFYPTLSDAEIRLSAAEQMKGGPIANPHIKIAQTYIDSGFGGPNKGQMYAEVVSSPVQLQFSADKSGGVMTPNLAITGLSRGLGPVGDNSTIQSGNFDPNKFFGGSNPKILGGLELVKILLSIAFTIDSDGLASDDTPKLNSKTMFKDGLVDPDDLPAEGIHTTYDWKPKLKADPLNIFVPDKDKMHPENNAEAELSIDITTNLKDPNNSTYKIKGELQRFKIQLFGTAFRVLIIHVDDFKFTAKTGAALDVDIDIDDVQFDGVLKFVEELSKFLPSTGIGPSIKIMSDSIGLGYSLSIPAISSGQFNLWDIKFGQSLVVPFTDKPVRFRIEFCTRDNPFKLTIYIFGGGGFFAYAQGLDGFELFEAALEFGVAASIDLGIASGSAKIVVGIYFKLEENQGPPKTQDTTLTGYFRAHGEVCVMGIISIDLDIYLGLTYESKTNKVTGTATVSISVHIVFFSISASVTVERKFGGQGDPTFLDAIPDQTTWNEYANAFAPLAA